jgi:hypothetical protein
VWSSVALLAGLVPSIGKVYSHDSYVNINSTSFRFDASLREFFLIPYANMGLVMGMTRGGVVSRENITDKVDPLRMSLGERHHSLMNSCPKHLQLQVHKLFLKRHKRILWNTHVPWYIPESLGGVGLMCLYKYEHDPFDIDLTVRKYANVIYKLKGGTVVIHQCGPSRMDVMIAWSIQDRHANAYPVKSIPTSQPIQARSVWYNRSKELAFQNVHVVGKESDMSFMDLSTYYLTPSLVIQKVSPEFQVEALHCNERAWLALSSIMEGVNPKGPSLFL